MTQLGAVLRKGNFPAPQTSPSEQSALHHPRLNGTIDALVVELCRGSGIVWLEDWTRLRGVSN